MNVFTWRRRRSHRGAPLVAATVITAAAAAVMIVRRRRRRRGSAGDGRRAWSCDCGQAYLVSGIDRHRIYWLPDAREFDPLLERQCVSCGSELPLGHKPALV